MLAFAKSTGTNINNRESGLEVDLNTNNDSKELHDILKANKAIVARELRVTKRDGKLEKVNLDKITRRLSTLCYGLDRDVIDTTFVAQQCVKSIVDGITTSQLDELTAHNIATSFITTHPDYNSLAGRIISSNLQAETAKKFSDYVLQAQQNELPSGELCPLLDEKMVQFIMDNKEVLDAAIVDGRDHDFRYFGISTLIYQYLVKSFSNKIIERPQYLYMRQAVALWFPNMDKILKMYELISKQYYTHATPSIVNAGTTNPQLASCFLLTMGSKAGADSIKGIFHLLSQSAMISKQMGGVGFSITNIRAKGAYIKGTNGRSDGIRPMLKQFNDASQYVNQGGRRPGSFSPYIELWHADIEEFLNFRKTNESVKKESERVDKLFYALWSCDLFMKRVEDDQDWTLFSPDEVPGLIDAYGDDFEELYLHYESKPKMAIKKTVRAMDIWKLIVTSIRETNLPYICMKDAANCKSNQKNIGTIHNSNLCAEIYQVSRAPTFKKVGDNYVIDGDDEEIAVCNLASLSATKFYNPETKSIDHQFIFDVTSEAIENLNRTPDLTVYPDPACKRSNLRHRPVGLGLSGLNNLFWLLRLPFDSPEAAQEDKEMWETICFAAYTKSCELAERDGHYPSMKENGGAPISHGKFPFDLAYEFQMNRWKKDPKRFSGFEPIEPQKLWSGRWDWEALRAKIMKFGIRNSLLLAQMPTNTSSNLLDNIESTEAQKRVIGTRRTQAGSFTMICEYLMRDLIELNLWSEEMKQKIIAADGSIQSIKEIPQDIRNLYKTAWDLKQRPLLNMTAMRQNFICQGQSFNVNNPTFENISAFLLTGWKLGLKTLSYYFRVKIEADAAKVTIDYNIESKMKQQLQQDMTQKSEVEELPVCSMIEGCGNCGT